MSETRVEVRVVHFSVAGEQLTELARQFWAGEDEARGYTLLLDGLSGITQGQVLDVLEGRAKLVGDSSSGIDIVPDCASESPKLADVLARLRAERDGARDEAADLLQLHLGEVHVVPSPGGARRVPKRKCARGLVVGGYYLKVGYVWEDTPEEQRSPGDKVQRIYEKVEDFGVAPVRSRPKTEAPDEPQRPHPPTPSTEISGQNGWLDRDGRFYRCEYNGHLELAASLGMTGPEIEAAGWVKVQRGEFFGFLQEDGVQRPSKAQLASVRDYCLSNGSKLPYWAEED